MKLSFISSEYIHGTEGNIIFTNRECVAMYVRSTLQEKTQFLQELQLYFVNLFCI